MLQPDSAARIQESVLAGDGGGAALAARAALAAGDGAAEILDGFIAAIQEVGRLWEEGEFFLPELVSGADAVRRGLKELEGPLAGLGGAPRTGRVAVLGTVAGDVHDIGKTLVGNLLTAHGFDVVDLGTGVPAAAFADAVAARGAALVGISALLTTTMPGQREVIEELRARGLREQVVVLVGGAPVTPRWAAEIGADGTASDAVAAAALACRLLDARGAE